MNDEEIRIAIAEACGWHDCYGSGKLVNYQWAPGHINQGQAHWQRGDALAVNLPDYPNALNAMPEAEKVLNDDNSLHGRVAYGNILMRVCGTCEAQTYATTRQRAEAFLRTLGRWLNTPPKANP